HAFSGPQSLQSGSGSPFTLFPPAAGTGASQNSAIADQQPLISLMSSQRNALVQVDESVLPDLRPGRVARVTVNVRHATVTGTVQQVIPIPVKQGGDVEYR